MEFQKMIDKIKNIINPKKEVKKSKKLTDYATGICSSEDNKK